MLLLPGVAPGKERLPARILPMVSAFLTFVVAVALVCVLVATPPSVRTARQHAPWSSIEGIPLMAVVCTIVFFIVAAAAAGEERVLRILVIIVSALGILCNLDTLGGRTPLVIARVHRLPQLQTLHAVSYVH
jgi:hypothetical protein